MVSVGNSFMTENNYLCSYQKRKSKFSKYTLRELIKEDLIFKKLKMKTR